MAKFEHSGSARFGLAITLPALLAMTGCSGGDSNSEGAGATGATTATGGSTSGGAAGGGVTSSGGNAAGGASGGLPGTGGSAGNSSAGSGGSAQGGSNGTLKDISRADFIDKVEGGWIGQMASGRWMGNMEFNGSYSGKAIAPESALTTWTPGLINNEFDNEGDETWAEIPYLDTLGTVGVSATWVDFGNSWRDSGFPDGVLFSANLAARNNLKGGMEAPESGYFTNTGGNAENQTWQMESNWTGMLAPGMVNAALDINWRAGHVALFGDALNGGAMVTAMQSTAFFATSLDEIIQAGRNAVPMGSKYRDMIEDVLGWYAEHPDDYAAVWQLIEDNWSSSNALDAKINGAMILLGMLFGNGDFEDTVMYTGRAGWDGDCTANDTGSIIGTYLGLAALDPAFSSALDPNKTFIGTDYTYQKVIDTTTKVAREMVLYTGGSISGEGDAEVWSIPVSSKVIGPLLEQWPKDNPAAVPPVLTEPVVTLDARDATFSITGTSDSEVTAYQWYFGDLSHSEASSSSDATHSYAQAGTYYVIAYATDTIGNTSWKAKSVTVP